MGDFHFLMHAMCSTPSYIQALINTIVKTYLKIEIDDFFKFWQLSHFLDNPSNQYNIEEDVDE